MAIPIPLQEALRDSITSGAFVDTKFWVFSRRGSKTGRVGSPRALFVNGHVAKRVPKLASLFDERKQKESLRTKFPTDRKPYTNNYDYEDDSDLEDGNDDDGLDSEDEPAVVPRVAREQSGNDATILSVEDSDAKSNESSDIISVSDMDSLFSEPLDPKGETDAASSAHVHVGKVVVIEDVAFVTFQALLRYLYTNEIEFASWGSAETRKARAHEIPSESYEIPNPSPKSIYRLADKYDIPELKEVALQQIRQDLSKCNIVEEALSKYTSWYPELRELELRQLAWRLLSADSNRTLRLLKKEIKAYTRGKLPHAKDIISALYTLMESDELVEEPPLPSTVAPNKEDVGSHWIGLKKALTASLTSGTFLDSQFYAVGSRSSAGIPKIRPIYFCSTVNGNLMSKLTSCSSKLRPRRAPVKPTDIYDSDIDDEELDQGSPTESHPSSKCVRENPTPTDMPPNPALTLNFGAARTWSAILLYVYTGRITFNAIASQVATSQEAQSGYPEDEAKSSQDHEWPSVSPGITTVEPCSPKSIYWLANKVGLTKLCEIAFKDIQSKLDEKNIMEELFSAFTADHKRVRGMEHELFQSKLKPLVGGALLSNIIESSSTGDHPHRAVAMELILEWSVQKRRKGILPGVKDNPQLDSTSRSKSSSEAPNPPVQQVRPSSPATAQKAHPEPSSNSTPKPALMVNDTSPGPSTASKPPVKTKEVTHDEPSKNTKASPSPVELVCSRCGNIPMNTLRGLRCVSCPNHHITKCTGCGTIRSENWAKVCTNCHGKFRNPGWF